MRKRKPFVIQALAYLIGGGDTPYFQIGRGKQFQGALRNTGDAKRAFKGKKVGIVRITIEWVEDVDG
jgi:hypothetical protein